ICHVGDQRLDRFELILVRIRGEARVTEISSNVDLRELQDKINAFWSWCGNIIESGGLSIRDENELKTWMGVLRDWLPSALADVVDLGTGQGFLALML